MTPLRALGIVCLILFCFGPVVMLIADIYTKRRPTKIRNGNKVDLKTNRIAYWNYLVLIISAYLLLIILLSDDKAEIETGLLLLGIGYTLLIISSYNRRVDIPKINLFLLSTCVVMAVAGSIFNYRNEHYLNDFHTEYHYLLFSPVCVYIFLLTGRHIIKRLTGTFPITLDKGLRVGTFYYRYQRPATYWDLAWSLLVFLLPALTFYLIVKK